VHRITTSLPGPPIEVIGDAVRLGQIFGNLLNNAAKFTAPGGRISIEATVVDDRAVVTVRDSGIGIPGEMLSRIFDRFSQVDPAPGQPRAGLGIGLWLVRNLVALHGGSVEARSDGPGLGSEFTVRLPLTSAPSPAAADVHPVPELADRPLAAQMIVVVDDNRDAADSLGELLELLGAKVMVAYDGSTALEAVRGRRPDVALLDLGMSGPDGYEVARRIRQDPQLREVVLIAVTGWGQEHDRRRSAEAGFDHHLVKPVELTALKALLRRHARVTR
jgi:CheY-like chemotaxis protein